MSSLQEQLRIRFYIHQNFAGDDFGVSEIKIVQACLNKLQHFIVRRIGAFAVLEYHHSHSDAFAPIQYIIRSKPARFPQDLTDAAFGAASSIRDRTNFSVLSDEYVHVASQFQPTHQSISGRCRTRAYFRDVSIADISQVWGHVGSTPESGQSRYERPARRDKITLAKRKCHVRR